MKRPNRPTEVKKNHYEINSSQLTVANMEKLKTLAVVMAVAFGISFLDGMFGWGLADGFYVVIGLVELVSIIWILRIVYKK